MKNRALLLAAIVVILAGVMYSQKIVNPLLMAFFISVIMVAPIKWMIKKKIPQGLAVFVSILLIIGVYVGFFKIVGGSIALFMADAPKYEQRINELTESGKQTMAEMGLDMASIGATKALAPEKVMQVTKSVIGEISALLSSEVTFLVLTIFLLVELRSLFDKVSVLQSQSDASLDYLEKIANNIRHYLSIKTVTSIMTGVFVAIGLVIVGVDYPILWGLIAFLLNYIPTIGSILAAVPAVMFALLQLGPGGATWTLVVFVVANVGVGNGIEPRMMGKGLGLSTFVVFMSLIFWGFILGPVGMFLSVILTMTIKIILEQNPKTQSIALMMASDEEVQAALKKLNEGKSGYEEIVK